MYSAIVNKAQDKTAANTKNFSDLDEHKLFLRFGGKKGYWDKNDFTEFLHQFSEIINYEDQKIVDEAFGILDQNKDDKLDETEFNRAWVTCLYRMLHPNPAIIVVDVQNDFISGSLAMADCPAKQDGAAVVPVINLLLQKSIFPVVVYTYDWHPSDHISFLKNVPLRKMSLVTTDSEQLNSHDQMDFENGNVKKKNHVIDNLQVGNTVRFLTRYGPTDQTLWPIHCVQGSLGALLHSELKVVDRAIHVHKGTHPDVDSYSAFFDNNRINKTDLHDNLQSHNVTDVYVCGLATDFCVYHTARHALELGYRTILIEDACRGVSEEGISKSVNDLKANHAYIAKSEEVPDLIQTKKSPLCLLLSSVKTGYS